jgi:hypothetical protein
MTSFDEMLHVQLAGAYEHDSWAPSPPRSRVARVVADVVLVVTTVACVLLLDVLERVEGRHA